MFRKSLCISAGLVALAAMPLVGWASIVNGGQQVWPGATLEGTYTVKAGDTLWGISQQLGVPLKDLIAENHITNPRSLQIGEKLSYQVWQPSPEMSQLTKSASGSASAKDSASIRQLVSRDGDISASLLASLATRVASPMRCELTAYTAGYESTGKRPGDPSYGITSTGVPVQAGVTVAVDPSVIPYGSKLYIPGIGFRIAQDTGGAIQGHHIDIYMQSLSEAIQFGVRYGDVYVLPDWFPTP
ncbi:3D domain-containing protein [Alicyclobacillus kakegawensis]|uniref:3D domain-containing protein n=1 Tax=Alicyclobacillus kakegawensis TaxID=392012 RepID=UPI0008317508|nr:3D domain-containing protein [Alicyclobacillus kakegawensis]